VKAQQGSGIPALGSPRAIPTEMLFSGLALQDFENLSANEIFGQIGQAEDMKRGIMVSSKDDGVKKRQNEVQSEVDPALEEVSVNSKRAHDLDAVFEVSLEDHYVVYGPPKYYSIRSRQWKRSVCGSGSNCDRL
jgi:hypothetical protein